MKKTATILLAVMSGLTSLMAHDLRVSPTCPTDTAQLVFSHVKEALLYAERHPADSGWTNICIEPSVYWLDDPDDPEVRRPKPGSRTPFALEVRLNHTRLIGLSDNPEDVVLACNRGQTQGADGNFTMLHITGSDIEARNITFGNYCNVDLVYPRDPRLNRPKRKEAIVQAQLAICNGNRYRLENCRFISRLNLCPFVGADTTDFDHCYFECTDDALCGTGCYTHCRFTFFSSKPFYSTYGRGATFIDCDIHTKVHGTQYLTKVSGPVVLKHCRWTSDDPQLRIEWCKRPDPNHHCLMQECTLNGQPIELATPTDPLPVLLPPLAIASQPEVRPGQWTIDCCKPRDTEAYDWQPDSSRCAWGYGQGVDGAEGSWGLIQLQRGARLMYTPLRPDSGDAHSNTSAKQGCVVALDPCKSAGQGFGSATGQYLDICIKFDTRTLTGYGVRFVRTPDYDKAVDVLLVEYADGNVAPICQPQRCDLFRRGCSVSLSAEGTRLSATISNDSLPELSPIRLEAEMPHPNSFGGFQLQHTGSTGASATVIKSITLK